MVDASLWFDDEPFSAAELGGILPADDLATIQRIAHGEVTARVRRAADPVLHHAAGPLPRARGAGRSATRASGATSGWPGSLEA